MSRRHCTIVNFTMSPWRFLIWLFGSSSGPHSIEQLPYQIREEMWTHLKSMTSIFRKLQLTGK